MKELKEGQVRAEHQMKEQMNRIEALLMRKNSKFEDKAKLRQSES